MSLFGSLFAGVSGLSAQSQAMGMISDNVANVNTVSYKAADAQFSTLVTRSAASATYSPGGAKASTLYRIDRQGLIQASASPTDVAIDGNGFFVVNGQPDGSGEQLYTRAGSFEQDFLGNLRNNAGFYLQGWALDANEQIININQLTTVNVRVDQRSRCRHHRRRARRQPGRHPGGLRRRLRAGRHGHVRRHRRGRRRAAAHGPRGPGVRSAGRRAQRPDRLPQGSGRQHLERRDLRRSGRGRGRPTIPTACSRPARSPSTATAPLPAPRSRPTTPPPRAGAPVGINWLDTAGADDSSIAFDLGTVGAADGLSQFAADYNVAFVIQNGAEVGELNGVTIDDEGYVIATFTNGATQKIYKLPIATFANPLALDPRTGNVYGQTAGSGEFNLREAGEGGAGHHRHPRRSKRPTSIWPRSSPK